MGKAYEFIKTYLGLFALVASWAFPPNGPDPVMRAMHSSPEFRLVGIPPAAVLAMQPVTGAMALMQIPKGSYGPAQQSDVHGCRRAVAVEQHAAGC